MTDLGGRRVNRRPCTDAEEAANWSLIADVINQITTNNNIFPGGENTWPFVRVQLDENFGAVDAGVSHDAIVLDVDDNPTGELIDVQDTLNRYAATGDGEKGYACIFGDPPIYEILFIGDGAGATIDPDDIFGTITIVDGPGPCGAGVASCYDDTTDTLYIIGTGGTDIKVKASGTDTTAGYLMEKIDATCQATRVSSEDSLVKFQLDNSGAVDQNIISFIDASAITNYGSIPDGADWPLILSRSGSTYTAMWQYPKVAVTADDTVPSGLHDALNLNATYVSGQDALIASATVGSAGTNQKERLFLDVSIIDGWVSGNRQVLGHDTSGALHWYDVGTCE